MTVARFLLGTLESVDRMALAAPFPNAKAGVSVLLDVGANVDSKPEHLVQFAVMGEIYYRATFGHGHRRPRVGLLSIGEEEIKGSLITQFAGMLSQSAFRGLKKTIDYTEYGGAPLLGVRGVCVIGHGRSNANAVKNAIRVAAGLAKANVNAKIEQELFATDVG